MAQSPLRFLPPAIDPRSVRATLGIVSDTHMGQRLAQLPDVLFELLDGVDLILHAGDVGSVSVLDELSAIAPVIAVQGNDDSGAAKEHLPLQQVVGVQGERVLLWHSHFVDPELERASRVGDTLPPKLERTIDRARQCGASLAVFGHWHIPLVWDAGDVLVLNPGALASANDVTRQHVRTIAIAWLLDGGRWLVAHISLENPESVFEPAIDWSMGFNAAWSRFSSTILDSQMRVQMPLFKAALPQETIEKISVAISAAAKRVWAGEAPQLTWRDIAREAFAAQILSPSEESMLRELMAEFAAQEPTTKEKSA